MEAEELFYRRRSSLRSGLGDAVEFGAVRRRRKQETLPRGPHRHAKEAGPTVSGTGSAIASAAAFSQSHRTQPKSTEKPGT